MWLILFLWVFLQSPYLWAANGRFKTFWQNVSDKIPLEIKHGIESENFQIKNIWEESKNYPQTLLQECKYITKKHVKSY